MVSRGVHSSYNHVADSCALVSKGNEVEVSKTIGYSSIFTGSSAESIGDDSTRTAITIISSARSGEPPRVNESRLKIDVTEVAGARLYYQALELSKKLALRRAKESIYKLPLDPILAFDNDDPKHHDDSKFHGETDDFKSSKKDLQTGLQCSRRLYNLSKDQQKIGKSRREAIALKSLKRNQSPCQDYGVLPSCRASDLYLRGMRKIREKEAHLEEVRAEAEAEIDRRHEFSLAEGAFALREEASFQERIYYKRYGHMPEPKRFQAEKNPSKRASYKEDAKVSSPSSVQSPSANEAYFDM